MRFSLTLLIALYALTSPAFAERLRIASTTSTQNSGLYDYLLPIFTKDTGIIVDVVAVGTGQAIRIAQNGDADVLLVHHRPSEDRFIEEGFGIKRFDVMYNDYVLVGPQAFADTTLDNVLAEIVTNKHLFISRGDESGTHRKEQELWADVNLSPSGTWYREIGAGMGAALNMAAASDGYTLSDRGTWLSFGNKGTLAIQNSGDDRLQNPYGLVLLSPQKFPHINHAGARRFAEWITSEHGQAHIAAFQINGKQLFCPILFPVSDEKCPSNKPKNLGLNQ